MFAANTSTYPHDMETTQTTAVAVCGSQTDERCTVDAMVLAFSSDPVIRWLFPDPESYCAHFPEFVRAFGGRAFEQRTAYHVDRFFGAALWLPPSVEPDEARLAELLQRSVPEEKQRVVFDVLEQMETFHPTEPCWYLPLIGVDPAHQRRGLGTALLQPVLGRCDRQNLAAYLEATSPRNIELYERHGFRSLGTIRAGDAPPLTPMVREPRA